MRKGLLPTGFAYVMHASGVANTLPTDTDYWQIIAQKGASGTLDELSSTPITGVIAGDGTSIITASADDLPYVNTTSGLTATDAQAAIDELASEKEDSVNGIGIQNNYVHNGGKHNGKSSMHDTMVARHRQILCEADQTGQYWGNTRSDKHALYKMDGDIVAPWVISNQHYGADW